MDTDLDTLATALYVTCDDLLVIRPEHALRAPERAGDVPRPAHRSSSPTLVSATRTPISHAMVGASLRSRLL